MTIREFLEMSCDDSDYISVYDIALGISATEQCRTFLHDEQYELLLEYEICSWNYDSNNQILCLNYDSGD